MKTVAPVVRIKGIKDVVRLRLSRRDIWRSPGIFQPNKILIQERVVVIYKNSSNGVGSFIIGDRDRH